MEAEAEEAADKYFIFELVVIKAEIPNMVGTLADSLPRVVARQMVLLWNNSWGSESPPVLIEWNTLRNKRSPVTCVIFLN